MGQGVLEKKKKSVELSGIRTFQRVAWSLHNRHSWNFFFSASQESPQHFIETEASSQSSCLYRASVTIKTLYYPTDAQIYIS